MMKQTLKYLKTEENAFSSFSNKQSKSERKE